MAAYAPQIVPYEMKVNLIKILNYSGKNPSGILCNPFFETPQYFENLTQFLFLTEFIMDSLCFPQRSMEHRLFNHDEQDKSWMRAATEEENAAPVLATFQINVLFRQNASWQGSLLWKEAEMEASFRSVLEMIGLMDNALSS